MAFAWAERKLTMTSFIQPYNPGWKLEFESLKRMHTIAIIDFTIDIQHVGSTSIPVIYAKPILDIDIIVLYEIHLTGISSILERLGYINRGGNKELRDVLHSVSIQT
jgi:GrpB-like predicted nucleotidyltransferase (UPF0157 family)